MKKPHGVCRYCGSWKASRRDNLGYLCCGLCSFMLYKTESDCLLTRADIVLNRYRSEWASKKSKVSRDILAFKGSRVAGQIRSGMIEARCKCPLCKPVLPGLFDGGGHAEAV